MIILGLLFIVGCHAQTTSVPTTTQNPIQECQCSLMIETNDGEADNIALHDLYRNTQFNCSAFDAEGDCREICRSRFVLFEQFGGQFVQIGVAEEPTQNRTYGDAMCGTLQSSNVPMPIQRRPIDVHWRYCGSGWQEISNTQHTLCCANNGTSMDCSLLDSGSCLCATKVTQISGEVPTSLLSSATTTSCPDRLVEQNCQTTCSNAGVVWDAANGLSLQYPFDSSNRTYGQVMCDLFRDAGVALPIQDERIEVDSRHCLESWLQQHQSDQTG